ncbi:hypothetical protein IFM89_003193 [Coptis chinensis]|uniref:Cytochrome P450 n=1 Tax=Coptis chinensis TaxID=261450 RepID=A0A835H3V2_9MAGN|nr:hypothetical protein IFM89_003193 [Coptis chinensis]
MNSMMSDEHAVKSVPTLGVFSVLYCWNVLFVDTRKALALVKVAKAVGDQIWYIRLIVVEALRLYPQPPILIRRSLKPDVLPGGYNGEKEGYEIPAGTDIFISVYNLHRSPYYWDRPHEFEPERFQVAKPSEIEGWAGFDPDRSPGAMYPNEVMNI